MDYAFGFSGNKNKNLRIAQRKKFAAFLLA